MLLLAPALPLDVCMMAEALEAAGLLDRLVTCWVFTRNELTWARRLGLHGRWLRRPAAPVSRQRLVRLPLADLLDRFGRRCFRSVVRATDASFALVDRQAARLVNAKTQAVIGREDACLLVFRRARERGVPTVYQLPTAHYTTVRQLIHRELDEFPEAFDREDILADFAPDRMTRKQQELEAAQYILCPSRFVHRSVEAVGVPIERITTIPLGIDNRWRPSQNVARQKVFLYVGNITARKGVHRLLRVWKKLGAYRTHTLRLIGDLHLPRLFLSEHQGIFEHIPRLPRAELVSHYSAAQAFVFNAMADGFGHVFAEAMVCGTAVLASRNCGAPDFVTDGVEGCLFEYGDDEQLATVLDWALSHPAELAEMGVCARQRALQWGWSEFGAAFLKWIRVVAGETQ